MKKEECKSFIDNPDELKIRYRASYFRYYEGFKGCLTNYISGEKRSIWEEDDFGEAYISVTWVEVIGIYDTEQDFEKQLLNKGNPKFLPKKSKLKEIYVDVKNKIPSNRKGFKEKIKMSIKHLLKLFNYIKNFFIRHKWKTILVFISLIIILSALVFFRTQINYLQVRIKIITNSNEIEWLSFSELKDENIRKYLLEEISTNFEKPANTPRILISYVDCNEKGIISRAIAYIDFPGERSNSDLETYSGYFRSVYVLDNEKVCIAETLYLQDLYSINIDELLTSDGGKQFGSLYYEKSRKSGDCFYYIIDGEIMGFKVLG